MATCSKRRVTEEDGKDDLKKSRVEDSEVGDGPVQEGAEPRATESDAGKTEVEAEGKEGESAVKEFIIGETCTCAWFVAALRRSSDYDA